MNPNPTFSRIYGWYFEDAWEGGYDQFIDAADQLVAARGATRGAGLSGAGEDGRGAGGGGFRGLSDRLRALRDERDAGCWGRAGCGTDTPNTGCGVVDRWAAGGWLDNLGSVLVASLHTPPDRGI